VLALKKRSASELSNTKNLTEEKEKTTHTTQEGGGGRRPHPGPGHLFLPQPGKKREKD